MATGAVFVHRDRCALCGGAENVTLLSRAFTDPPIWGFLETYYEGRIPRETLGDDLYEIVKCSRCAFIWQAYILNDRWMAELYDRWIGSEDSLQKRVDGGIGRYARQMGVIAALFPRKAAPEIHVLDFGMGWGFWCLAAKARGFQVVGLELSEERLRFAREQGIESWRTLSDNPTANFDFINAEQVFEHIPQPRETLTALAARLNPGGVVRIAVPDGAGMEHRLARQDWQAAKDALHPLEHINCFTRQTLTALGQAAGLRVVHPPLQPASARGLQDMLKSAAGNAYRRFFGTAMYFRKPGGA